MSMKAADGDGPSDTEMNAESFLDDIKRHIKVLHLFVIQQNLVCHTDLLHLSAEETNVL